MCIQIFEPEEKRPGGEVRRMCLLRKQRTTSCEREHDWRALVSTPGPAFSSDPILLQHKDSYYCDIPDARITFVVAAQHILLALNASPSRAIET
jgi:hypothetical protein